MVHELLMLGMLGAPLPKLTWKVLQELDLRKMDVGVGL